MPESFFARGGAWVIGQFILMAAVVLLGWCAGGQSFWKGSTLTGGILMGAGGALAIAGVLALGSGLTPFPGPSERAQLVQRGVYGIMRHPLYTSVVLTAMGWGLFRHSWAALLAAGVLAVFFDRKARREESFLRQQFPGYAEYQRRVRRFLPGIY